MKKDVLVIGSTTADIILNVPHIPLVGDDLHIRSQVMRVGGCAFNCAKIIAQFHVPYTLFSPIGSGAFGDFVANACTTENMHMCIERVNEKNGCCYCLVDAQGERTFLVDRGAEYHFQSIWFHNLDHERYDSVYLCGLELEEQSGDNLLDYLEEHFHSNLYFAPGPRIMHIPQERMQRLLQLSPTLHMNQQEAFAYTNSSTLVDATKKLYAMTKRDVIITLGDKGTLYFDGKTSKLFPTQSVKVVDTIGAGDAHIGTIIAQRTLGKSFEEAIQIANVVSTNIVQVTGSTLSDEEFNTRVVQVI